jgi:flagellar assembly factor FliW
MNIELSKEDREVILEISEKTIQFPKGLPGLKGNTSFILTRAENETPFFTLRSTQDPSIGLTVVDPRVLMSDYRAQVSDADLIPLASPQVDNVAVLVVVILEKGGSGAKNIRLKANLRSPILINTKLKTGLQVHIQNPPAIYTDAVTFDF